MAGRRAKAFPITATIAGVKVVTIPLADYAGLLECQGQAAPSDLSLAPLYPRSAIEDDAEVADFLAARYGRMTLRQVLAGCTAEFGPDRTPSRSAAHRYWMRLRKRGVRSHVGARAPD